MKRRFCIVFIDKEIPIILEDVVSYYIHNNIIEFKYEDGSSFIINNDRISYITSNDTLIDEVIKYVQDMSDNKFENYECTHNNDYINIGDSFIVNLTGSHNTTITASVCYIDKNTICLLGDTSLGEADWPTQCTYAWNYTVNIKGKNYTGICRIPTYEQICSKCAGYKRDFNYWLSTRYDDSNVWRVIHDHPMIKIEPSFSLGTIPFIEITL